MADRAQVQAMPRRRRILYAIALIAMTGAWYVVLTDPIYTAPLRGLFGSGPSPVATGMPDGSIAERQDPPARFAMPRDGAGAQILDAIGKAPNGHLVASMGDCSSCSKLDLERLYRQAKPRGISLVAFSSGEQDRISRYGTALKKNGVPVRVFQDEHGALAARLNSYYSCRLYYFDSNWKLRWLDTDYRIDNYLFQTGRFDRIMRNIGQ